jgi:hypothetical protein
MTRDDQTKPQRTRRSQKTGIFLHALRAPRLNVIR